MRGVSTRRGVAGVVVKLLGISRGRRPVVAFVAISDPNAGHRYRYTVWTVPLGTSAPHGAAIVGRELDLRTARWVVRQMHKKAA